MLYVKQDVKHGWNFTYKMLKQAYTYRMTLDQFCQLHLAHENIYINDENWTLLEIIRDFFKVVYDATVFFSGLY